MPIMSLCTSGTTQVNLKKVFGSSPRQLTGQLIGFSESLVIIASIDQGTRDEEVHVFACLSCGDELLTKHAEKKRAGDCESAVF